MKQSAYSNNSRKRCVSISSLLRDDTSSGSVTLHTLLAIFDFLGVLRSSVSSCSRFCGLFSSAATRSTEFREDKMRDKSNTYDSFACTRLNNARNERAYGVRFYTERHFLNLPAKSNQAERVSMCLSQRTRKVGSPFKSEISENIKFFASGLITSESTVFFSP